MGYRKLRYLVIQVTDEARMDDSAPVTWPSTVEPQVTRFAVRLRCRSCRGAGYLAVRESRILFIACEKCHALVDGQEARETLADMFHSAFGQLRYKPLRIETLDIGSLPSPVPLTVADSLAFEMLMRSDDGGP